MKLKSILDVVFRKRQRYPKWYPFIETIFGRTWEKSHPLYVSPTPVGELIIGSDRDKVEFVFPIATDRPVLVRSRGDFTPESYVLSHGFIYDGGMYAHQNRRGEE